MAVVLIVADDSELRDALTSALTKEGFSVEFVTDGDAALGRLRSGPRPDAILLNVMMPNMSGWRFRAQQLTNPSFAAIPTIVITATGSVPHAAIAADNVLPKPITPDQLLATLRRYLPSEPPDDEAKTNPRLRTLSPEADLPPQDLGGRVQAEVIDEPSWRLVTPSDDETCRWEEETTRRWVAVGFGKGGDLGSAVVKDSTGVRRTFDSYEDAIRFCNQVRKSMGAGG